MPVPSNEPLLVIDDLAVSFDRAGAPAVDGVSLTIRRGRTVAVVGESGCGKSVTALSVLGLLPRPAARILRGRVLLSGRDLLALSSARMRRVRGGEIAMIFQEPMSCLNPVRTAGEQVIEAIRLHRRCSRRRAASAAEAALDEVGIARSGSVLRAYPHQLSGGMCQRVMIAMALACRPRLLLADEPTTALDVTIQAQILALLRRARRDHDMAMLLITHDLGVVAGQADVVAVMYAGRIVEHAPVEAIFSRPLHPYTAALLGCRPSLRDRRARLSTMHEMLSAPGAFRPLPGCEPPAIPWWPGRGSWCLRRVQTDHWVACQESDQATKRPSD
jgi:ABC-type dipeptide/oligopeptide/nickel transport system ATPase component